MAKYILTERQIQVFELYKKGLSQEEIAQELCVTQSAINGILKRVGAKLGELAIKNNSRNKKGGKYVMYEYP